MYPHERSLVKRLEDKPFALIGVNSDRNKDKLKKVMEKEQITWRSWRDGGGTSGPIASKWNVQEWPVVYILDHKGVIRHKPIDMAAMDKVVDALLKDIADEGASP